MINEEIAKKLKDELDCIVFKEVPGHGICGIKRFMYTHGILSQLNPDNLFTWFYGRWCYPDFDSAKKALEQWDGAGDPPGDWIKYKGVDCERHHPSHKEPWEK
jgi:hypothetical protein